MRPALLAASLLALFAVGARAIGATPPRHRSAAVTIPATGVLDTSQVYALLDRVVAHRSKDVFDAAPDLAEYDGRTFRIVLQVPRCDPELNDTYINPAAHSGCWQYNPDTKTLHLDAWKLNELAPANSRTTGRPLAAVGLSIGGSNRVVGGYVGQNAFGAKREVEVSRFVKRGIAAVSGAEETDTLLPANDNIWTFSRDLPLPPAAARQDVQGLTLVVDGAINATPQLGAAFCIGDAREATYAVPEERSGSICVLSAKIDRIAFVRASGDTLTEWVRKTP